MIKSIKSKPLKNFFEKGDTSKLQPHHIRRIRILLGNLHLATSPEMMDQSGYKFHELKGDRRGFYSVWINGNYRLTFRFIGLDAFDVDYEDYH